MCRDDRSAPSVPERAVHEYGALAEAVSDPVGRERDLLAGRRQRVQERKTEVRIHLPREADLGELRREVQDRADAPLLERGPVGLEESTPEEDIRRDLGDRSLAREAPKQPEDHEADDQVGPEEEVVGGRHSSVAALAEQQRIAQRVGERQTPGRERAADQEKARGKRGRRRQQQHAGRHYRAHDGVSQARSRLDAGLSLAAPPASSPGPVAPRP